MAGPQDFRKTLFTTGRIAEQRQIDISEIALRQGPMANSRVPKPAGSRKRLCGCKASLIMIIMIAGQTGGTQRSKRLSGVGSDILQRLRDNSGWLDLSPSGLMW